MSNIYVDWNLFSIIIFAVDNNPIVLFLLTKVCKHTYTKARCISYRHEINVLQKFKIVSWHGCIFYSEPFRWFLMKKVETSLVFIYRSCILILLVTYQPTSTNDISTVYKIYSCKKVAKSQANQFLQIWLTQMSYMIENQSISF